MPVQTDDVVATWRDAHLFPPLPRVAAGGYQTDLCRNCRRSIYLGPVIYYEPDLDAASEKVIWRHQSNAYASCMTTKVDKWATPGGAAVVTLCGSTKFMEEFTEVNRLLTLEGVIVISVGLFGHREGLVIEDDNGDPTQVKVMLDELHKRKIDLADAIFVVNPGGYIGSSTRGEIDYAIATGKPALYLDHPAGVS